jgi:hypothetical protein
MHGDSITTQKSACWRGCTPPSSAEMRGGGNAVVARMHACMQDLAWCPWRPLQPDSTHHGLGAEQRRSEPDNAVATR